MFILFTVRHFLDFFCLSLSKMAHMRLFSLFGPWRPFFKKVKVFGVWKSMLKYEQKKTLFNLIMCVRSQTFGRETPNTLKAKKIRVMQLQQAYENLLQLHTLILDKHSIKKNLEKKVVSIFNFNFSLLDLSELHSFTVPFV